MEVEEIMRGREQIVPKNGKKIKDMTPKELKKYKRDFYKNNKTKIMEKSKISYQDKIETLREEGGEEAVKKFNQERGQKYRKKRDSDPVKKLNRINKESNEESSSVYSQSSRSEKSSSSHRSNTPPESCGNQMDNYRKRSSNSSDSGNNRDDIFFEEDSSRVSKPISLCGIGRKWSKDEIY